MAGLCAAGLPFGSFINSGRCFWQFSNAQPDLRKELKKGAAYLELFPPLFSLEKLLHLKNSVNKFSSLTDARVIDAFAVVGGIARPVLLHQKWGQTVEDLRNSVRSKIITMAEPGATGWQVLSCFLLAVQMHMQGMAILLQSASSASWRRLWKIITCLPDCLFVWHV